MPTRAPTKREKETWLDLMPEGMPIPEVISHDELLDRLQARGVDLKSSALQYYRHRGILPRPIRRRHEGVTQPVYPYWFVQVIEALKNMQAQGMSLDEIRTKIGPVIKMWAFSSVNWRDTSLDAATAALDVALREYAKASQPWLTERGTITSIRVSLRDDSKDDDDREIDYHDVPYVPD